MLFVVVFFANIVNEYGDDSLKWFSIMLKQRVRHKSFSEIKAEHLLYMVLSFMFVPGTRDEHVNLLCYFVCFGLDFIHT